MRLELLALTAVGQSDCEIAERFGVAERTVRMHRQRGQLLMGLSRPEKVVQWARREGLLAEDRAESGGIKRSRIDGALAELRISHGPRPSVAASHLPVLVADEQLQLLDVSAAACRVLGYGRDEILALDASALVAEEEPAADLLHDYLADGEQVGCLTLRRRDGSLAGVSYQAHVVHRDDETLHAFVFVPTPQPETTAARDSSSASA
jgi:PAS domain S-box-containing protein